MKEKIEAALSNDLSREESLKIFQEFKAALNSGAIRSAEPDSSSVSGWRVNTWVKQGILLGFKLGDIVDMSINKALQPFFDKATYPVKQLELTSGVRVVPGGSSIRDGAYVAKSVTCMPPMYINVGAYVDEGTMIDSHALVGSCAQIGKKCHISAAAQIGGVLEPVGALPVIIEDQVMVGGNCGVYEGVVVKKNAVLGSGVILNRSTPIYDLVTEKVHLAESDQPLIVPEGAVVIPGARAISKGIGNDWKLSLYTPVIVKYRDDKTDSKVMLEDLLRP
jgi:2,3,4,5-tetrahydropyridine-2-carboxylate N-succinyltransferase